MKPDLAERGLDDRLRDAVVDDRHDEALAACGSAVRGVIVSSSSSRLQRAGRPSTVIDADVEPDEVEVEADRFCVARARIVATPAKHVRRRVVAQVERVVLSVVAAVAVEREVRVADAGAPG